MPLISAALMRRWAEWIEARVPIVASSVSRLFENDPRALQAFFFLSVIHGHVMESRYMIVASPAEPTRTDCGGLRKRGSCFSNVFLPC